MFPMTFVCRAGMLVSESVCVCAGLFEGIMIVYALTGIHHIPMYRPSNPLVGGEPFNIQMDGIQRRRITDG